MFFDFIMVGCHKMPSKCVLRPINGHNNLKDTSLSHSGFLMVVSGI